MVMSAAFGSVLSGVRRHSVPDVRPARSAVRVRPGIRIACPASALRRADVARQAIDQGMWVEVRSGSELDAALSVGVEPQHIGVHCDDLTSNEMVWAASLDVGRLVVSSEFQAELVSCMRGPVPHNIWLQSGSDPAVLDGYRGLRLAGLDASCGDHGYGRVVGALMDESADVRRDHCILVGHLSLSVFQVSSDVVDEIDDAVTEGCIRYRLPRPQVMLCGGHFTA